MAVPPASVAIFGVSGVIAFAAAGDFPDLVFWGIVALALATIAYLGTASSA